MQISLNLDLESKVSLQRQIFDQVIGMIRGGKLRAGGALPSSRDFSRQLGVSRNTVWEAYEKLAAEGYVCTVPARGTFVSAMVPDDAMGTAVVANADSSHEAIVRTVAPNLPLPYTGRGLPGLYVPPSQRFHIDFRFGRSDAHSFPEKIWRRQILEVLGGAPERLSQYNDPAGLPELRALIANYVGPARGMTIDPEQVIIVGGFQQGINLAAHLLVGVNTPVAMEAPCYRGAAFLFESYGGKILPVPVDASGIDVERLPKHRVKLLYVSPSHQFPTGVTMARERRAALVEWAARNGSYILEVDYDSDFRYEGTLLPSLQSLDPHGCVIYLNSFSRSIGPGLRLGYMVVPRKLMRAAKTLKALIDNGSPWLEQATLAAFIGTGNLTKHIKRLRHTYQSRRDAVRSASASLFPGASLTGAEGGTHMLWRLPADGSSAIHLAAAARPLGIGLHSLEDSAIFQDHLAGWERCIVLGYAHLNEAQIEEGFKRTSVAWQDASAAYLRKAECHPSRVIAPSVLG